MKLFKNILRNTISYMIKKLLKKQKYFVPENLKILNKHW